ncbi:hypothetical protein BH18THE2_BH18THE2_21270 [soil metagenome]
MENTDHRARQADLTIEITINTGSTSDLVIITNFVSIFQGIRHYFIPFPSILARFSVDRGISNLD